MLRNAGLAVTAEPARLDEDEVKRALRADGATAGDVAETLAALKAERIARRHPDALVVGADQMLVLPAERGDEPAELWLDKPIDRAAARAQLALLSGRRHTLLSAAVVYRQGTRAWHALDTAQLSMRALGDGFLDDYLDRLGDQALASVGGYQLEGLGAQLFDRVEGDFFTILGLPLLPLLRYLRQSGELPA